ncbi:RNA dependent RNA polymerase-domain-containing protein [Nemania sp. FL0916]|nr:RNA dependent RNA polymerase-domain-containing protein [Nemania sp. FL0916]
MSRPQQHPIGFAVFLSNVPLDLTDQSLKTQLSPFLDNLGIKDCVCDKPRNKSFATVTFLHWKEGQKFLNKHGEQPLPPVGGKPKSRSHLSLLRKPVYCRESDKGVDPVVLRVLELNAEEREHPVQDTENAKDHKTVVFETRGLSCGHYDYPKETLTYVPDIQWTISSGIAKFARKDLIISFDQQGGQIRLEIPYRNIHQVVSSDRPTSLFLTLWEPPRIFHLGYGGADGALDYLLGKLSVAPGPFRPKEKVRLSSIPHSTVDHGQVIGQSLIYHITLSPQEFASKMERLKENENFDSLRYRVPIAAFGCAYMEEQLAVFKSALSNCARTLPFDLLYQFQALVQNGYLQPLTVQTLLVRLQQSKSYHDPKQVQDGQNELGTFAAFPISALAVKKLISQIPFPGPYVDANMFTADDTWALLEKNEKEIHQGLTSVLFSQRARQNLTMVYKVQVTPTRIMYMGPEPEAKNRILRKFSRHTGYFARVQFCEEDGQDLYFNPKVSLQTIYQRFKKILSDGFSIAGRLYKFLGFSHSSLRAHAVWFMAGFIDDDQQLRSYATVIPELGNFKGIRSPARWYVFVFVGAARIGQAFSETPVAVNLVELETNICEVPDIKSKDGSRVFSDGVGTISSDLLEAVRDRLPPKWKRATCLQIRWAGGKGMLSLDVTLKGNTMCVRDSMVKFVSQDTQNLEICDIANKPIPLVLNRQMIKILEDMGLPHFWFFKAQNRELNRLRKITASTNNTVLFLKRRKIAEQMGFHQFIRRLSNLGLDYRKDAFLCSVVEAVVLREVRLLKHKSRIPIEQGVTLFGVMDEFGYLGDEEVFITCDNQDETQIPTFHDRLVIITRSPALHPGDIQIRRAIVPPYGHPLRSLSNCIVFSQKGSRDLPSQLSGGDLDGDIYNIIWDPIAVDGCKLEFEPADYPRVSPLNIGRDVRAEDMTDFFVDFMATDQLGLIATRHIILADLHEAGTIHDKCKLLAEMHSTAVDYSKTGIPVDMSKMASLRAKYRPDFMAPAPPTNIVDKTEIQFEASLPPAADEDEDDDVGPKHMFYPSDKILGKLYRAIDEKQIWRDDIHVVVNRFGPSLWDELIVNITGKCQELFGEIHWQRAKDEASSIRQAYDDQIWTATLDYSDHSTKAITEVEVFTGTIFNKSGIQTRRQRDKSTQLKDEFDRITKWVEGLIRKYDTALSHDDCDEESVSHDTESTPLELSIACLHVGVTRGNRDKHDKRNANDFESFKIIAAHCALRELELATKQRDIAEGAAILGSGGFPGVKNRRN